MTILQFGGFLILYSFKHLLSIVRESWWDMRFVGRHHYRRLAIEDRRHQISDSTNGERGRQNVITGQKTLKMEIHEII